LKKLANPSARRKLRNSPLKAIWKSYPFKLSYRLAGSTESIIKYTQIFTPQISKFQAKITQLFGKF